MRMMKFAEPGDDRWPPCVDPFCQYFEPEWWPEAPEQRLLDNADAEVQSPLPPCPLLG